MSSSPVITLYDLPSRGRCHCWTPNPWKTRLALNYKEIPYKTEWLEYPEIAPKFKAWGIPPSEGGMIPYTIPTVHIPDSNPEYIMDSKAIATALEAKYPSKPLHLDSPILAKLEGLMPKHYQAMMAVLIPRVPRVILNEASIPYFEETRKEWYGMSLAEFEKVKGGEDAWVAGMEIFKEIAALLNETKGPYFMGDEVSYADINLVAMFQFYKCAGDDVFDRLMAIDASFPALFKAAGPWLERDGH